MKKVYEIYDVSKEYELEENSVIIIVSDWEKEKLLKAFPSLCPYSENIMTGAKWDEFLDINDVYHRNENKFRGRENNRSAKSEIAYRTSLKNEEVEEVLDKTELKNQIKYALSSLKAQPRKRFEKYYFENKTYREIAKEEGKSVSTVHESIQGAAKTFIKYFYSYPEQNTTNK